MTAGVVRGDNGGMVWRWLIRGVFFLLIFLILLCAGGWVESYGHRDTVRYITPDRHRQYFVSSVCGSLGAGQLSTARGPYESAGYFTGHFTGPEPFEHETLAPGIRQWLATGDGYFCGFLFLHDKSYVIVDARMVAIPYYFLILLFSGVLLIVWRKTRERKPGGLFPVEMKTG